MSHRSMYSVISVCIMLMCRCPCFSWAATHGSCSVSLSEKTGVMLSLSLGGAQTDFCTSTDPLDLWESWWQVSFWSRALIRSTVIKTLRTGHHIRRLQAESGCLPNVCPTLKTTFDIRARRKISGAPETQHPTDNKWQLRMKYTQTTKTLFEFNVIKITFKTSLNP